MSWQEQYLRIRRGLTRIAVPNKPREEHEDDLFHLFIDCWHLKDWIANDAGSISLEKRKKIVAAVHADEVVMACREIANARKYLKLRRKRRGRALKPKASLIGEITLGEQSVVSYVVTDKKGKTTSTADELAQRAVNRWGEILTKHRLRLPVSYALGVVDFAALRADWTIRPA